MGYENIAFLLPLRSSEGVVSGNDVLQSLQQKIKTDP